VRRLEAFTADLREHDHADNVIILLFSEFGRRVHDNGSGTDHGCSGASLHPRDKVKASLRRVSLLQAESWFRAT